MKQKTQVYKVWICLFIGIWVSQLSVQAQVYPENCGIGESMKVDGNNPIIMVQQNPWEAGGGGIHLTAAGLNSDLNSGYIRFHSGGTIWGKTAGDGLRFGNTSRTATWVVFRETGYVGIGTVVPAKKLHVSVGDIRLDNNMTLQWGGTANYIYGNDASDFIGITTNGYERFRITANGNIGLGTTTPNEKLEIWDNNPVLKLTQDPTIVGGAGIYLTAAGGNSDLNSGYVRFHSGGTIWGKTAGDGLRFGNTSRTATWVVFRETGNVGIGTTIPNDNLVVATSNNSGGITIEGSNDATLTLKSPDGENNFPSVAFYQDNSLKGYIQFDDNTSDDFRFVSNVNGDISFLNSTLEEKVVINTSSGNIGIGVPDPSAKLEVDGEIKSSASVTAAEFKVGNWVISEKQPPDYVFEKDYDLKPLDEVAKYISEKKHLPEVPSAAQMKKEGIDLVDMNLTLLKKIEELTLYVIKQQKEIEEQHKEIKVQKREIEDLKRKIGE